MVVKGAAAVVVEGAAAVVVKGAAAVVVKRAAAVVVKEAAAVVGAWVCVVSLRFPMAFSVTSLWLLASSSSVCFRTSFSSGLFRGSDTDKTSSRAERRVLR